MNLVLYPMRGLVRVAGVWTLFVACKHGIGGCDD
jgi:hypothetical protein